MKTWRSRTSLAQLAVAFAARAHRHQTRKDGVTPYVAHAVRVAFLIAEFGIADDEVIAAALLRDTIEDCPVDYDEVRERFGANVADWVACLSKDTRLPDPRRERAYLGAIAAGPWQVQTIKLADVPDNLRDSSSLSAERKTKTRAKAAEVLGWWAAGGRAVSGCRGAGAGGRSTREGDAGRRVARGFS